MAEQKLKKSSAGAGERERGEKSGSRTQDINIYFIQDMAEQKPKKEQCRSRREREERKVGLEPKTQGKLSSLTILPLE